MLVACVQKLTAWCMQDPLGADDDMDMPAADGSGADGIVAEAQRVCEAARQQVPPCAFTTASLSMLLVACPAQPSHDETGYTRLIAACRVVSITILKLHAADCAGSPGPHRCG